MTGSSDSVVDEGGTTVAGVSLDARLGVGSTGTVYVGHEQGSGRRVAVKVLAAALAGRESFRDRLRREAAVMARLEHPNCVAVYRLAESDETLAIIIEYVHGASLRAVVEAAGRLEPQQAVLVLKGALAGLEHAHRLGLVHRDIKPENVLVDMEGTSKLADFGLVVERSVAEPSVAEPSVAGNDWRPMEGTPAYMAPEQVRGQPVDARTDVYACGTLLYELLAGRAPFEASSPFAVLRAQVEDDPPPLGGVAGPVASVAGKALAKDPAARHQSAQEFADALEDAARRSYGLAWAAGAGLAGIVAGVVQEHADPSPPSTSRRGRTVALAAAAVIVAGSAVGATLALTANGHRKVIAINATAGLTTPVATTSVTAAPTTAATVAAPTTSVVAGCGPGTGPAAATATGQLRVSPCVAPVGGVLHIAAVTPCPPQPKSGGFGSMLQVSAIPPNGHFLIAPSFQMSGAWTADIPISAGTPPGRYQVNASCLAVGFSGSGGSVSYAPVAFSIVAR